MLMLNLKFQLDKPSGLVDVHAFITDQEDGQFLVYCRQGNDHISRVVATYAMATSCLKEILDRLDQEVAGCRSQLEQLTA